MGKARSPPPEWSPVGDCARVDQVLSANIRLRLSGPGDPSYPAAQFPKATPPLLVHSLEVKQVPFRLELKTKDTLKTRDIRIPGAFLYWGATNTN